MRPILERAGTPVVDDGELLTRIREGDEHAFDTVNHIRHLAIERKAEPELASVDVPDAPAPSMLVGAEIDSALPAAIAALPPRCREVFELSRVGGLRYAEIALALGISVKTVEAQMGKALRVLRGEMAAWLPDGE
jgi:RNA polymerase sigma-70 factor (ECF subfamily)